MVTVVGAAARRRVTLRRVVVTGDSMLPALSPGDRLLVVGPWPPRPGHVVAVPDPRHAPGRVLVKRVASVHGDLVDLRGDNRDASTDSRVFGAVPARSILGRAVYRYQPSSRRGWWP